MNRLKAFLFVLAVGAWLTGPVTISAQDRARASARPPITLETPTRAGVVAAMPELSCAISLSRFWQTALGASKSEAVSGDLVSLTHSDEGFNAWVKLLNAGGTGTSVAYAINVTGAEATDFVCAAQMSLPGVFQTHLGAGAEGSHWTCTYHPDQKVKRTIAISVVVDGANLVRESKETNNTCYRQFTVEYE